MYFSVCLHLFFLTFPLDKLTGDPHELIINNLASALVMECWEVIVGRGEVDRQKGEIVRGK